MPRRQIDRKTVETIQYLFMWKNILEGANLNFHPTSDDTLGVYSAHLKGLIVAWTVRTYIFIVQSSNRHTTLKNI